MMMYFVTCIMLFYSIKKIFFLKFSDRNSGHWIYTYIMIMIITIIKNIMMMVSETEINQHLPTKQKMRLSLDKKKIWIFSFPHSYNDNDKQWRICSISYWLIRNFVARFIFHIFWHSNLHHHHHRYYHRSFFFQLKDMN